ncbi:BRD4-interacting chromatin-remodeling complex-associated protein isoform X2 [Amblyraja radiata]|uniref:BRD4-interacting chromatin-remodeling complex-associated protein isoform X2 n=1 Tax=Amblyraja radiata TaxID=386614 RepID=UPI001403A9FD|nr:BRD4-interacting chromatin-remodeling complex-associated protein isoform X2 [Amblyraja radiata]
MMSAHAVDMDDEDGRCLLDVICDPQALNDFLHGSDQLDGEDLLDTNADPASAFFTDASLNVQDASVNHLNSGQPPSSSGAVDLDFLEDDILGPSSASNLPGSAEPCDILQQSLQEANITEQSLEDDAGLDIGSLHFSSLQPVSQGAEAAHLFAGSTELMGLQQQPSAVLAQQTLIQQQTIAGQVVNKAINIQPFLQQVGLGNVTLQPVSNIQGLPNGSPSGTLGIGQIQVVGQLSSQPVMAQQIIGKAGQPTVTTVPGVSYISSPASEQQVSAVSPTNASLVLQKNAGPNAHNGNSLFAGQAGVRPASGPTLMQAQLAGPNVIVQRTPTPIQPKPSASLVQHKLFQISSKPFCPSSAALSLQADAPLQQSQAPQQKAQPNVAFMAGKPGQNVVFSASGPGFSSGVFKPQQAPPQAFGKPLSLQLQGGSIVIQPQHMHQAMLQGQNQFLLQGQLTGGQLSQQLSALAPGVGGQILTAQPTGPSPNTTHIITNQGLPAQILTNQGLAGQINLGQVIAQNAHGATHILSGPIQLQAGPVGPSTVFQMPVSLAGGLGPQGTGSGTGSAVIQGVAMPGQPTVLGAGVGEAQAQAQAGNSATTTSLVALGNGQGSLLTVQSPGPPLTPGTQAGSTSTAPTGKIVVAPSGPAAAQDTTQVFFQQEQRQQQLYQAALKLQQERGLNQPPHSLAPTITTSSVPASVIVSSSLGLASGPIPDAKGHAPLPTLPVTHFQHTLPGQMAAGQQKTPTSQSPAPQATGSDGQLHIQMSSPHQSRPPSQPQPLSRPPSRPQSRPSSQPQPLSRPPSEPLSRSCTPSQLPLQPLYVIQTQLQSPPQPTHPMRPPSQPHLQMQFQNAVAPPQVTPPPSHSQAEAQTPPHLQPPSQPLTEGPPPQAHVQLQLHCSPHPQPPLQPVYQTVTLTAEQQQRFQMVTSQLQTMATHPNPSPQHKTMMEKLQQMQHSIILQAKPGSGQTGPGPTPLTSTPPTMLLSGQGQSPGPQPHPIPTTSTPTGLKPLPQGAGQVALASLLQQTSVLIKTTAGTTATTRSTDSKVIAGPNSASAGHLQQGAAVPLQIKPLVQHQMQPSLQTKTGVISSISGLNMSLSKGPIQIQLLGKGLTQLVPAGTVSAHQMESKLGSLKTSLTPQPPKESMLLERLRGDQDGVLQPNCKSPFRTHHDTLSRLLPYHLYQGTLPSVDEHRNVDEEFEAVSTQLLKRTQAMLHKYRMLLFEEARRLSPSAEMVMIDRMFIQEEKTSLSTDRQLAKDKPDEYVASSSRCHNLPTSSSPPSSCSSLQEPLRLPLVASSTPVHGTKLVIKQSGGSPCVSWARVGGGPEGGDDDTLHTRSRPPPMKTYEARSRIGLKLKIKQEAGLSKVVHNTALDPVHQPVSSVIRSTECPAVSATARQLNGGLDHHASPSPTDPHPHPPTAQCKLPPRKSLREAPPSGRSAADPPASSGQPDDGRKDGRRDVLAKCEPTPAGPRQRTGRGRAEGGGRKTRTHAHPPPARCEEPPGSKEGEGGLRAAPEELVRGIIKAEPTDGSWELALPPPKRTKCESFDMDNASFSSDSPQDDTLTEHLQSAIDSILNLRQPQSSLAPPVSSPYHASEISSPFSPTTHSDTYLAPNRNGGLGARTYTR